MWHPLPLAANAGSRQLYPLFNKSLFKHGSSFSQLSIAKSAKVLRDQPALVYRADQSEGTARGSSQTCLSCASRQWLGSRQRPLHCPRETGSTSLLFHLLALPVECPTCWILSPSHFQRPGDCTGLRLIWMNCQNKMLPVTAAGAGRAAQAGGCWCLSSHRACQLHLDLSSRSEEESIKHLPKGCVCYMNITNVKWGRKKPRTQHSTMPRRAVPVLKSCVLFCILRAEKVPFCCADSFLTLGHLRPQGKQPAWSIHRLEVPGTGQPPRAEQGLKAQ